MKRFAHLANGCLAGLVVLLLAGCHLPETTCTPEELQAPIDLDPNSEMEVLDPEDPLVMTWGYPATGCSPDFFEVYVWTGLEPETPGMTGRVDFADPPSPGEWRLQWPTLLEPGNTYYWRVYPGLETGPGPDVDGPDSLGHFFTGPVCSDPEAMLPAEIISPDDDITIAMGEEITFAWDDPTGCLVDGLFEISFADNPAFSGRYGIPILQTVYTTSSSTDLHFLEECSNWYWRIKTDPAGPWEDPFSETRTLHVQSPGVVCPLYDLRIPSVIAGLNLNCRSGPSIFYEVEEILPEGGEAEIQGRNQAGDWWYILSPNRVRCWVWGSEVEVPRRCERSAGGGGSSSRPDRHAASAQLRPVHRSTGLCGRSGLHLVPTPVIPGSGFLQEPVGPQRLVCGEAQAPGGKPPGA